jgi:hypothetical protein
VRRAAQAAAAQDPGAAAPPAKAPSSVSMKDGTDESESVTLSTTI